MATQQRAAGMVFIFTTIFLDIVGIGLIIPIMPQLVAQFVGGDLSEASRYYGALGSVYTLMQFLFAPMLGAWSDQVGRKPVLLISLFGTALSYLMMALSPSLVWLFVARTLAGIAGASLTVATTYIADVSSPEDRAKNFGMVGAAFGIGFIIGPAVGGLLGSLGLHVPFYVAAAITLLNFLYGMFVVPESHVPENRRKFTWDKANPFSWVTLLRKYPVVMGLTATFVLMGLAQNALHSTWVLFTTYRFQWGTAENGWALAVVGLNAAIVQGGLIRVLMPKLGEQRAIVVGLLVGALGFLFYGLATEGWMMYVILTFASLGGLAGPAIQGLVSRAVGPYEQGAVQGALTSLMSLTGVVGPMVSSQLFAEFTGARARMELPGIAFFVGSALMLLAMVLAIRLFGRLDKLVPAPGSEPAAAAS